MQISIHSRKEIKTFWKKIREDVVGGPAIISTRKAVVDETFARKSTNNFKSVVGIDASQLYPYSMFQLMPTGLRLMRFGISIRERVEPHLYKTRPGALEIWSCHISNQPDQNMKLKASLQQADR